MAIARYDPLGVGQLQSEINRLFTNLGDSESSAATAGWVPNVDIFEFGDHFHLEIDLPGVDPAQVEITLDSDVLTISGERQPATETNESEKMTCHRAERGHGRFHRRFVLPDTVDADKVEAKGRFGTLEITIPKQAKAQPRRISIAA